MAPSPNQSLPSSTLRTASHETGQGSPRPSMMLAGGVAVLLLLGAGAVSLRGGRGATATAATAPSPGPTASGLAAAVPNYPGPGAPTSPNIRGSQPLLSAPRVSWQLFSGVALPYSPTAGPLTVDGPVYSGFERSQAGALIAAVQLGSRYLLTPGSGWREVVARQVLPGAGREVFIRVRAQVEVNDPPGTYGQLAGFRIVAYTGDVAVIQEVSRFSLTGRLQVTTATVKWVGGDWQLELQPDGGSSPTAQAVPNLDGFVVWGGA